MKIYLTEGTKCHLVVGSIFLVQLHRLLPVLEAVPVLVVASPPVHKLPVVLHLLVPLLLRVPLVRVCVVRVLFI